MRDIMTFEEVFREMNTAYDEYLKTGDEERLWGLCHQVLSNAMFVLNEDEVEDEFTYEFPDWVYKRKRGIIGRLLATNVGRITKVHTLPMYGTIWFSTNTGDEYDDDSPALKIWEIYNVALALYHITEPFAEKLYNA